MPIAESIAEESIIDARGMRCPWPALRAARAMRSAARVTILADDPIAPGELAALANQQGWIFETLVLNSARAFRFTEKKGRISVT